LLLFFRKEDSSFLVAAGERRVQDFGSAQPGGRAPAKS
jgi:hypothetical protein